MLIDLSIDIGIYINIFLALHPSAYLQPFYPRVCLAGDGGINTGQEALGRDDPGGLWGSTRDMGASETLTRKTECVCPSETS